MTGLMAKKLGMTQIFNADGDCVPVTVLECGPCTVVRKRTQEKDGYHAIVLGYGEVSEKQQARLSKAEVGVFKKAGTPIFRHLREIRFKDAKGLEAVNAGDKLTVEQVFKMNQRVDVSGVSKGRGFAGVIKRHHMHGAARDSASSHEHHRHIGAIGQRKTPGKVWKGKKLPGHMGVDNVTIQNLTVVGIEAEKNVVLIAGAVPGHNDGLLFVQTSVKGQPKPKKKQEERVRAKAKV
jgi:large subunit ribosomal protein L3